MHALETFGVLGLAMCLIELISFPSTKCCTLQRLSSGTCRLQDIALPQDASELDGLMCSTFQAAGRESDLFRETQQFSQDQPAHRAFVFLPSCFLEIPDESLSDRQDLEGFPGTCRWQCASLSSAARFVGSSLMT